MGKSVNPVILKTAISSIENYIKTNVKILTLCSEEPKTYKEATETPEQSTNTYKLAEVPLTADNFISTDTGLSICIGVANPNDPESPNALESVMEEDGIITHLALCTARNALPEPQILYVTTCDAGTVTKNDCVKIFPCKIVIADPM